MNRRSFLASLLASSALVPLVQTRILAQSSDAVMAGSDPMAAAERLSELESSTYYPMMYMFYSYIHPDAIPYASRGTVIGWYQADFHPRGPRKAIATSVTWLDSWTWAVSGQTYRNVAEVSYTQAFNDGSVDYEKVRLVYHDGAWRWFFGRDAEWVKQQYYRFSLVDNTPQGGVAPFGLHTLTSLDSRLMQRLPQEILDPAYSADTHYLAPREPYAETDTVLAAEGMYEYKGHSEFAMGYVTYGSVKGKGSQSERMLSVGREFENSPPVNFEGWNSTPEAGPSWLQTMHLGVDVVGHAYRMTLVSGSRFLRIHMYSPGSLEIVCTALATGT